MKPMECCFKYRDGRKVYLEVGPKDDIRIVIPVIILDGTHFVFSSVSGSSVLTYYECATPKQINTEASPVRPKLNPTLQTFSGKLVSILEPVLEDIDILDIAHSLSMICRYNGHVSRFYSVAEHSVLMCRSFYEHGYEDEIQRVALMHDAPEYLTGDVTKPLKGVITPIFRPIQNALWGRVATRFGLLESIPDIVHAADLRILMNEKAQVFVHDIDWGWNCDPLPDLTLQFWTPEEAKVEFLKEAARLGIA